MLFYLRPVEEDDTQVVEVERDAAAFVLPHGVPQSAHGRRVADAFDDEYRAATSPPHALTEHFPHKVGTPPAAQTHPLPEQTGYTRCDRGMCPHGAWTGFRGTGDAC